jgi:hypothetical protein
VLHAKASLVQGVLQLWELVGQHHLRIASFHTNRGANFTAFYSRADINGAKRLGAQPDLHLCIARLLCEARGTYHRFGIGLVTLEDAGTACFASALRNSSRSG